ncbi:hypothetical protein VD0002_g5659 [Verticillium dahliae]|uniref:Uncharacterized protein n=2 Tax=Verticillium dahliae TaxID=27337 RepID=G2WW57_VERDV|nr:uncharacterized protein VDAG_01843 [Verticillium dahliae VdLs.17]KAF3350192.1 hypothetical protein VdG2_02007 [Verticillium dahliae VDG2]KAH6706138.1 AhpC/TSA antioxidant enzyme-domain-containing protein [Verticillium dahliae]EGY19827.1 hypothetical protein VDAG_01843 [Verticillium dahliae VdLs.17]PNH32988.1 hypothetical protein BJF96_g3842 [Verticillium dahliae]PNH45498.1 hypothetical protein VD0004_g2425 [Verticillium dahliae]
MATAEPTPTTAGGATPSTVDQDKATTAPIEGPPAVAQDTTSQATTASLPLHQAPLPANAASEGLSQADKTLGVSTAHHQTLDPSIQPTQAEGSKSPTTPATQGADSSTRATSVEVDTSKPKDFEGEIETNNEIPSTELIRRVENYVLLDRHGKTHTFKSLHSGRNVARRMLFIFVRHFFCGNCQEFLRAVSESITTESLLRLPVSTFITVIGCGDPGLIQMYAETTNCPFPIYTDPTRSLYKKFEMTRTWDLGSKPAYMKKSMLKSTGSSIIQGLKQVTTGLATKSGDFQQVGGEFLFEPMDLMTPVTTPQAEEVDRTLGDAITAQDTQRPSGSVHDDGGDAKYSTEEKRITWCHRMRSTRDHAEVPELMEVLGLTGNGKPIDDSQRWTKALQERKGTGLSLASQMSQLSDRWIPHGRKASSECL